MFCVHLVPLSSSLRGHTPTRPVYISSVTKAIHCNFPARNTPSGHYQHNDLFFLFFFFLNPSFLSPLRDLNTDNPSSNKYIHTYMFFFFSLPSIPSIHTGMEDNPPERNIEGLETEAEECASRKQNRRNSSLTCSSSVDGQQELFPHDFTLSFPHFFSPPTFSTLFLYLPLGASLPFHTTLRPPTLLFFYSNLPLLFPLSSLLHFTRHPLSTYLSFSLFCSSVAFLSFL